MSSASKPQQYLFLAIGFLFSILITSCGKDSDDNKTPPHEDNAFSLLGSSDKAFATACEVNGDYSENEVLNFQKNTFDKVWKSYDGADCLEGKTRVTYIYRFLNVEKAWSPIEGWQTYNYTVSSATAQTNTIAATNMFNEKKVFGYDDWKINEPKSVAGRQYSPKYEAKPKRGAIRNSTAKREDETLYLARYIDNRPTVELPFVYKLMVDTPK